MPVILSSFLAASRYLKSKGYIHCDSPLDCSQLLNSVAVLKGKDFGSRASEWLITSIQTCASTIGTASPTA